MGPSRRRLPGGGPPSRATSPRRPALPNQSAPRRPDGGQARPIPTLRGAGPVPMATGAEVAGAPWGCRAVPYRTVPYRTVPYRTVPGRAGPRHGAEPRRSSGGRPGGAPFIPRVQATPRPEVAAAPLPPQRHRKMKWLSVLPQQCILLMTCLLMALEAVPIDIDKTKVKGEGHVEGEKVENPDTGLYYDEYLRQVIDVLETDKHFREKLQTADIEEIKSGKLSRELDLVSHHVRTRLDELKRQEVARLRMLIKAKMDSVQDTGIDHQALLKQFEHLNHQNPDTFEPKDLDMLIKAATSDLENYDKTRHEEFKKYEMMKEHERREYLKTLDEEKRQREESKFEEMKKKHGDHPKVHHPGSKDQLKEVWEEADGLDPNEFDPKTFFKLHDVNNDGFLDEQELEALFTKELEKVYDPKNEEDDMVEMEEERLRMREHVMNEVDINKDRLVTLEEFLRATEKKEFLEPDSWETLDQQQLFTEDELKEFESHISQQEDELRKKAEDLQKQKEELQRQHDQLQAQKQELQQVVKQMEQKKLQQGNPPAGPAGELKFQPPEEHKVGDAPKHPAGGDQPLPPGHIQEPAARTDQVHP